MNVDTINSWMGNYPEVDFVLVYIREAHASDAWPLGDTVQIPNHKTIEERKTAAIKLQKKGLKIPILLDSMNNDFERNFAVWPERYFIVVNGKVEYVAFPTNEFGFDRPAFEEEIKKIIDT